MTSIDLTPIIQAVIGLLAALITWKVIPWIRAKTTKEQQANLETLVRTLVYAAEQLYGANKGEEKLDYVIARLEEKGYKADRSAIEAAVFNAFNFLREEKEAEKAVYLNEEGEVQLNPEKWTLEQLKGFCGLNEIPTDGCATREDYMEAIEIHTRDSGDPPTGAAERREDE